MQNDKATDIDKMNIFLYGRAAEMADRLNFIMEFVTTLKKVNRSGQSIFEYVILTCLLVGMLFGFSQTTFFQDIRNYLSNAFDRSVIKILQGPV
jgi:hypothetical protein